MDPEPTAAADWLVIESTYGDREHRGDPLARLAAIVRDAAAREGALLIPAFAVGRAQLLLHFIARLKARKAIADVPVYLNSPMATDVTRIYHEHRGDHGESDREGHLAAAPRRQRGISLHHHDEQHHPPHGTAEAEAPRAAAAAHAAYALVHPDTPLHFEYSTTKGVPGGD